MKADFVSRTFRFRFNARTSRGPMPDKTSWFIRLWSEDNPGVVGIGECGPLPGLSPEEPDRVPEILNELVDAINSMSSPTSGRLMDLLPHNTPAVRFALETALFDLEKGGKRVLYHNSFLAGHPIPINGLVWMGDADFMERQVRDKVAQGFTCIKLKVGALDFEKECSLLEWMRAEFAGAISIRLDANGAFTSENAMAKLERLAKFNIHSIEQPVRPRDPVMRELCEHSPIPVALDEELIGVDTREEKQALLETLKPQFIILKPTLHGGLSGSAEWISLADTLGTGWWITSALESAVGLNAVSQFTAALNVMIPQGLGTGMIYENNFESPLRVSGGELIYDDSLSWQIEDLVRPPRGSRGVSC